MLQSLERAPLVLVDSIAADKGMYQPLEDRNQNGNDCTVPFSRWFHELQHRKGNKSGIKAIANKQEDPVPGDYEFPRHFHPALSLGYNEKVLRHISGKAVCLPSHLGGSQLASPSSLPPSLKGWGHSPAFLVLLHFFLLLFLGTKTGEAKPKSEKPTAIDAFRVHN
jgi:hypothetical protein